MRPESVPVVFVVLSAMSVTKKTSLTFTINHEAVLRNYRSSIQQDACRQKKFHS
jgi:hypothetical protein